MKLNVKMRPCIAEASKNLLGKKVKHLMENENFPKN